MPYKKSISSLKRVFLFLFSFSAVLAQQTKYTTSNAHSHNDYLQKIPFKIAYQQQFGSIEADIFLQNDTLYVAHERHEIRRENTLKLLYLDSLSYYFHKNSGSIYEDKGKSLQLLIDLKTGENTLEELVTLLENYKEVLHPIGNVKVVISGSVPAASRFNEYPDFIYFDGRPETEYTAEELMKIGLISQSLKRYSLWDGKGLPAEKDRIVIQKVIEKAHSMGKPFRFWANPDEKNAWEVLMSYDVDYINTDKVKELADFIRKY